jgi:hypothetical protein
VRRRQGRAAKVDLGRYDTAVEAAIAFAAHVAADVPPAE